MLTAIGDETRQYLLLQVLGDCRGRRVVDIADRMKLSRAAVSHHIRILRMKGLVRWRRSGKAIYYVLKRLFSLRIIRNCWMNMTEMTEFVL